MKKTFFLSLLMGTGCLSLVCPLSLSAKDNAPKSYETGKLLDTQESKETRVISYNTTKNKNGSTVTTPVMDTVKLYDISVKVGDMTYVGRYEPTWSFSKRPNWVIGDPIEVRIDKDRMYIKKPDGKKLKTKVVKRIRS